MNYRSNSKGHVFIAMHDSRGALVSAAATLTTGTATSFLAGDADYMLDLVEITLSNNTTVAGGVIGVSLINDGTTIKTFSVQPGTNQFVFDAPLRQNTKNTPWNLDMDDVTGNTIVVEGTFIKKQPSHS